MNEQEYQTYIAESFKVFSDAGSIVFDGPMNFSKWKNQNLKILFYYKETYGYNDFGGTSISKHFDRWILDNKPTSKKKGLIAYLLLETIKNKKIFDFDEKFMRDLYVNHNLLIESLSNASVLNVNKLSIPENKTSDSVIRDLSRENKTIIKSQLELLTPNVIICGGRVVADSLYSDINYLSKNNYDFEKAEIVDNKIIAPYMHLSSSSCWYEKIYHYYLQIATLMHHKNLF